VPFRLAALLGDGPEALEDASGLDELVVAALSGVAVPWVRELMLLSQLATRTLPVCVVNRSDCCGELATSDEVPSGHSISCKFAEFSVYELCSDLVDTGDEACSRSSFLASGAGQIGPMVASGVVESLSTGEYVWSSSFFRRASIVFSFSRVSVALCGLKAAVEK
jgi:hypothetical protein